MKSIKISFLSAIFLAIFLCSCEKATEVLEKQPVQTARQFISSLNADNPSRALDFVCESMVLPSLPKHILKDVDFEEISNNGEIAEVNIFGEIRLEHEDIGALKKNMDFTLVLEKRGSDWCIERESLVTILEILVDISE